MKIKEMKNQNLFQLIQSLNNLDFLSEDDAHNLDLLYFNIHSGEKLVLDYVSSLDSEDRLLQLAEILNLKYKDKWNKIFNDIEAQFDPLVNRKYKVTRTPNITKTDNRNRDSSSSSKESTKLTTTNNKDELNKINGFNSSEAVNSDSSLVNTNNVIEGSGDDNITENDSHSTDSNTQSETGEEVTEKEGFEGNYADNIESAVRLKMQYNLFDIMMNDVDKMITLLVY